MEEIVLINSYWVAYAAAFTAGEILLVPIVYSAKQGSLDLFTAMLVAFAGTMSRDWLVFLVFRFCGQKIISRFSAIRKKTQAAKRIFVKKGNVIFYAYRLMFGLVNIVVITLALSGLPKRRFLLLSIVSNCVMILLVGNAAYYFTEVVIEKMLWIYTHKIFGLCLLIAILASILLIKGKRKVIKETV